MLVTIPNANNFQVHRGLFIAAWKVWFKRFSDVPLEWREGRMPIGASNEDLSVLIEKGQRFSLEVTCRLMVPWSFRNQQVATNEFIQLNPALLRRVPYVLESGETVEGVRLTDQALDMWDNLTFIAQDLYMTFAEARIQADIETSTPAPIVIDDAGIVVIGEDIYPPLVPEKDDSVDDYLKAIAAWIQEDPFQPMYQRQAVGEPISGWDNRLKRLFWPKPRMGYTELSHIASPLLYRCGLLAEGLDKGKAWDYEDRELAVKTANEIFLLYGVPQREVNADNVLAVFLAALNEDAGADAKMNSGWSQLAAYATHFLEAHPERTPMVYWCSRIATSLISRLDFLMVEAGRDDPETLFPGIGRIPGWGGTRPRELSLEWPDGYRKWSTQIAASHLVKRLRDILNTEVDDAGNRLYPDMPLVGGDRGPWTVLGVQRVLFSDGY